jgi:hypothetical protein
MSLQTAVTMITNRKRTSICYLCDRTVSAIDKEFTKTNKSQKRQQQSQQQQQHRVSIIKQDFLPSFAFTYQLLRVSFTQTSVARSH